MKFKQIKIHKKKLLAQLEATRCKKLIKRIKKLKLLNADIETANEEISDIRK